MAAVFLGLLEMICFHTSADRGVFSNYSLVWSLSPFLSPMHLSLFPTVSYSAVVSGQAGQVTAIS